MMLSFLVVEAGGQQQVKGECSKLKGQRGKGELEAKDS